MSDILIDISASDDWSKDEITLVEKILLFSFKALSNKKLTEISVRLTGDEEIKLLKAEHENVKDRCVVIGAIPESETLNVMADFLKNNGIKYEQIEKEVIGIWDWQGRYIQKDIKGLPGKLYLIRYSDGSYDKVLLMKQ